MPKTNKKKFFPQELEANFAGNGVWILTDTFEYRPKNGKPIIVPTDFKSDGASIPRFAYSIIGGPWTGKYTEAAVIHDWLYYSQTTKRVEADKTFILAMRDLGVSWWRRVTMYRAVRSFGWIPWGKRKKERGVKK